MSCWLAARLGIAACPPGWLPSALTGLGLLPYAIGLALRACRDGLPHYSRLDAPDAPQTRSAAPLLLASLANVGGLAARLAFCPDLTGWLQLAGWVLAAGLQKADEQLGWRLRAWMALQALVGLSYELPGLIRQWQGESTAVRLVSAGCATGALLVAVLLRRRSSASSFDPGSAPESYGKLPAGLDGPRLSEQEGASLSVSWIQPLLRAGNKAPLQEHSLYDLLEQDRPAVAAELARAEWARLAAKDGAGKDAVTPSRVWWLLWRLHGATFCLSGVLLFMGSMFQFVPPLLLRSLLLSLQDEQSSTTDGYLIAGMMLLVPASITVFDSQAGLAMMRLSIRVRAALTSLIFAKALRLSQPAQAQFTHGFIVNLMQIDTSRFANNPASVHRVWTIPLKFAVCVYLLYTVIGRPAFVGVLVLIVLAPGNRYAMKRMLAYTREIQILRDKRVKLFTEVLSGIKIIKMLGWESQLYAQVESARAAELMMIRYWRRLQVCVVELSARAAPLLLRVLGLGLAAWADQDGLTPAEAFTALSLFDILVGPVTNFPKVIQLVLEIKVSMDRIGNFLAADEVEVHSYLDSAPTEPGVSVSLVVTPDDGESGYVRVPESCTLPGPDGLALSLHNALFRWRVGKAAKQDELDRLQKKDPSQSVDDGLADVELAEITRLKEEIASCGESPLLPIQGNATLQNVSFTARRGTITCIVGPVGAGKSSLLQGILNEVPLEAGRVEIAGKIAYCSQQPFILHSTVKENILFGRSFNAKRYKMALEACALVTDISAFAGGQGDETEIGEKGLNLSGGQKAGISLARAVYSNADLYLIDDVLSAVDVGTAQTMMEKGIFGVLANKTILLATHRAARWLPKMDQIILMENIDGAGRIVDCGSFVELVQRGRLDPMTATSSTPDPATAAMIRTVSDADSAPGSSTLSRTLSDFGDSVLDVSGNGLSACQFDVSPQASAHAMNERADAEETAGLVVAEDRETGAVASSIWILYFRLLGVCYCPLILGTLIFYQALHSGSSYWVGYYTGEGGKGNQAVDTWFFVTIYGSLLLGYMLIASLTTFIWSERSIVAGTTMHSTALWATMRAPMLYFDTTLTGRIVNRFANDLQKVDIDLFGTMKNVVTTIVRSLLSMGLLVVTVPSVLVVLLPLIAVYWLITNFYRASARELQRLSSGQASPIYAMFGETLSGLATERAYGRDHHLQRKNVELLAALLRPQYLQRCAQLWLDVRLGFLSCVLNSATAVAAVWHCSNQGCNVGMVGFSLQTALTIVGCLHGYPF